MVSTPVCARLAGVPRFKTARTEIKRHPQNYANTTFLLFFCDGGELLAQLGQRHLGLGDGRPGDGVGGRAPRGRRMDRRSAPGSRPVDAIPRAAPGHAGDPAQEDQEDDDRGPQHHGYLPGAPGARRGVGGGEQDARHDAGVQHHRAVRVQGPGRRGQRRRRRLRVRRHVRAAQRRGRELALLADRGLRVRPGRPDAGP
ncbi:hypothetical protein EG871_14415, partial [Enterococcus faecium]